MLEPGSVRRPDNRRSAHRLQGPATRDARRADQPPSGGSNRPACTSLNRGLFRDHRRLWRFAPPHRHRRGTPERLLAALTPEALVPCAGTNGQTFTNANSGGSEPQARPAAESRWRARRRHSPRTGRSRSRGRAVRAFRRGEPSGHHRRGPFARFSAGLPAKRKSPPPLRMAAMKRFRRGPRRAERRQRSNEAVKMNWRGSTMR